MRIPFSTIHSVLYESLWFSLNRSHMNLGILLALLGYELSDDNLGLTERCFLLKRS